MDMNAKLELHKKAHINRWYVISKNMAKCRGEQWLLTFEEFFDIWNLDDRWLNRGRYRDSLCLSRIDMTGDWDIDNVEILTRVEMLRREARMRKEQN